MKKIVSFVLIVTLSLTSTVHSMAATTSTDSKVLPSGLRYDMLSQTIENFAMEHLSEVPGVVVGVFDRDGFLYENWFGWADKESKIPMNSDTVVEWGSVTKLLLWISVMQLWERGDLDLEKDIRVYLPDGFLRKLRYETPISILDLMNHRAGFEESFFKIQTSKETDIVSLEEYLRTIQPEQVFEPNTVVAYSNWGAALAAYIIERISGIPYWQYVHENIFVPLGMDYSAICTDLSDNLIVKERRNLLKSYTVSGQAISDIQYINAYPAGACVSTLSDLVTFGQALLSQGLTLFKSVETWKILFSPTEYYGDTDIPMCFHGFFQDNSIYYNVVWHNGSTVGCSSNMLLNLDAGVGMVVMSNRYAEKAFNEELPQLIFGRDSSESYIKSAPKKFSFFESGRNIFSGPLKIYRLLCIRPASSLTDNVGQFTMIYTEDNGVPRISAVSCDLLARSIWEVLPLYVSAILWLISFLFSFLVLFSVLIRTIRRNKKLFDKVIILACTLELFPLFSIPAVMSLATQQWPIWCYQLWCVGNGLVMLALCVCAGVIISDALKNKMRIRQRSIPILSLATTIISVWNLLYWDLFSYWKIS